MIDASGWLSSARKVPSPNFNHRPNAAEISLLVIHNISLPPKQFGGPFICDFFTNCLDVDSDPYFQEIADLRVSSHLLIDRDGSTTQFVALGDRAWHAGQSCFDGVDNCNDCAIGIELEGADDIPYTDEQYQTLVDVTRVLITQYPAITKQRIVGHSHIASGRKTDPGPAFDWPRYFKALGMREE
jgi:AmpD protein